MKIISNKLMSSIAAFAAAILLAGCSNILDKDSTSSDSEKGRLIFSASARAVNTVVPSGFDFSKDTGLTFTLTGALSGGKSATLGSWSDSEDSLAYSLMAADETVLVDTGSWTFRLSVAKDGGEVLYGTKTLQVVAGGNPLDFGVLSEASADDETRDSSIDVAKGSVSVTLSFPAGKAVSAQSLFYSAESDDSEAETSALELSAGEESDSVVFTKEADRGTYILEIRVYTDEAKEQSTSYTALVIVAPGLASTAQAALSSLNAQYTVTYSLNGGSFAEGTTVRTSYSPADIFTLPQPEKDYYEFKGWAKSSDATAADYAAGESISVDEDTALYALWTFSSDKLAEYISSLTEDTTVVIRGALANSDLTAINTAIKNGSYKIALDLSETTGLTEIKTKEDYYTGFKVVLESFTAANKISVIKAVREITGLGLGDAKALVESVPQTIKENLSKDDAIEIVEKLTEAGGNASYSEVSYLYNNGMFYNNQNLSSIVFPDSIISIEDSSFYGCTNLGTVEFGSVLTSIGDYAFYGCASLTSITIPDSVTSIGEAAFKGCTGLTNVEIGDGMTSIGGAAFSGCKSLSSVIIPDSVTSLGGNAFGNCTGLTSMEIGDGVTSIEINTFNGCTGLTSVTIPDSVTSIGNKAFYGCTGLISVTIGDGVTSIGDSAFEGCKKLASVYITDLEAWCNITFGNDYSNPLYYSGTLYLNGEALSGEVVIPDGVTKIPAYTFKNCTGLTSITIPASVKIIGNYAFRGCTGLTEVTIPDSVTSIGSEVFSGCTGLTSVEIGDGVTSIGNYMFSNCTGLTSITIPDSVTSIGNKAFKGCTGLTEVTIGDGVTSIGEAAFYDCTGLVSVIIPDSVSSMGERVFVRCKSLKNAIIGNNVTSIGKHMFYGCTSLTSITIPDSVTNIGNRAFYNCTSLTSISIPDSVMSIEGHAFENCTGLASVDIGDGVTSIGATAFYNCTGLTSVEIGDSVTSIGNDAFKGCTKLSSVYITDLAAWCNISFGNDYSNPHYYYHCTLYLNGEALSGELVIPDGVTKIPAYAFRNCTGLTSVTIPDSVTSIENKAFSGCTGLTSVEIGDSVTSIGATAFNNCTGLTSVEIGDSVTSIGGTAFYNCTGLTSVEIGDSVTSIGNDAFKGCTKLSSVYITDLAAWCNISFGNDYSNPHYYYHCTLYLNGEALSGELVIPDGVTKIPAYAFRNCTGLTSVTIPDSVISIGNSAFANCKSLTSVKIGDSVTGIGYEAFYGCEGLTSVTIGGCVEKIEQHAFMECSALTSATFKDTADWYYTTSSSYTSGTALSSTNLANTSTAATYLKTTYYSYYWFKE